MLGQGFEARIALGQMSEVLRIERIGSGGHALF
jgi:hypothetical protein